jgi:hypothetical protein
MRELLETTMKPKGAAVTATCAICGRLIRLHAYKGWYHPTGYGHPIPRHRPQPAKKEAPR